ncbi:c-type cytochrome [Taklimakanibacter deserti]|uniref:c-type cytochrome n=1 Tax=Taklimakanibacter deserti TaxID=2267839 RepID=UPI000E648762
MGDETGARGAEAGPFRGETKKHKSVMKLPQVPVRIVAVQANAIFGERHMVKPANMLKIVPAVAVIATLGATLAFAGAIEDRQAGMKQVGKAMGAFAGIAKGEAPYDAAVVKTNADSMREAWKKAFANFTAGSEKGPPETYAKAEIWSDPEGFKAAEDAAFKALDALAATSDEAGFKTALGGLGEACKGCHTKFRRPKD